MPCPIKFVTGISCPGCGMSRAYLSVLTFDFKAAFYYHPLWIAVIPAAALMAYFGANEKELQLHVTLAVVLTLLFVTWLFRLLSRSNNVVVFDPENGLIFKVLESIKNIFYKQ